MIFGIKQIIKMLFQQLILPVVYNACTVKPVIPGTVILADAHHDKIPFSMLAIKKNFPGIRSFRLQKCTGIITNLLLWRFSGICFLSWKIRHNGNRYHLWQFSACRILQKTQRNTGHTALACMWRIQKFGYDTEEDIPSYYVGNVMANCSLVTVSSDICIKPLPVPWSFQKPVFFQLVSAGQICILMKPSIRNVGITFSASTRMPGTKDRSLGSDFSWKTWGCQCLWTGWCSESSGRTERYTLFHY